jgi:hypothetical protein
MAQLQNFSLGRSKSARQRASRDDASRIRYGKMEGVRILHLAKKTRHSALAGRFEQLVEIMPPQAIRNDSQYRKTLEMIDRLMSRKKLTQGQALYGNAGAACAGP